MESRSPEERKAWLEHGSKENGTSDVPKTRFRKSGRTTFEKVLLLLVVLLLVALIAVIIILIVQSSKDSHTHTSNSDNKGSSICLTEECVSAAARIHSNIDYSVSPCEDFYQFSCGRWMKENVIPEDMSSYTTFIVLRDQVNIVLKNLLEEKHRPTDLPCFKKVKDLYASCMNMDLMNEKGDEPLKNLVNNEFGGWPLTYNQWDESKFDFLALLTKLNQYSVRPLVSFFVGVDNKNSTKRILKMDQPSLGLPGKKYYQVERNDSMLMAYETFIYGVGEIMGFAADPDTARQEVADLVDFEIALSNIFVADEDRRDSNEMYNPLTLAQIRENYSELFDWRTFVHDLTSSPDIGLSKIEDDEVVINYSPQYYTDLTKLLKETPTRTIANYMMWKLVKSLIATQGDKYHDLIRDYNKALYGVSTERARFRVCSSYVTYAAGLAVGRMFIKDNFDADSKTMALEMIAELQYSFNQLLDDLDWMDETTKKVAKEKNEFISTKIGYPDDLTNNTYLEEQFSNYTFNKDEYFENVILIKKESFNDMFRRLREPVDKEKWSIPPSTVNAFYSSQKNQIMFPAGILQPPFFSKTYPKSLNFGGIGFIVGHEISHAFDDRGRQYDKYGNLVQWWSQSAIDKFKGRAQCIVDQYGNFTLPEVDMNLNGVNTQGENIADNGGIKQAYKAYRNWVEKQGKEEPLLPGLNFTHNQLFFINFAQLWCILMREGDAISMIRTGAHSPGRFRVIGSAQNFDVFSEAFNCPRESYMNPKSKCTVW